MLYPDPPPPDPLEKWVRGAFGALLGLFFAFKVWTRSGPFEVAGTVLLVVGCVAVCVVGAVRYGDAFWIRLLRR